MKKESILVLVALLLAMPISVEAANDVMRTRIFTCNKDTAGTDADVWIKFYGMDNAGVNRWTKEYKVDNAGDDNERNYYCTYDVGIEYDFNNLYLINIRHDNTNSGPEWCIDKIVVDDRGPNGKEYYWTGTKWLQGSSCSYNFPLSTTANPLSECCSCKKR